jgi:hypothetical protein
MNARIKCRMPHKRRSRGWRARGLAVTALLLIGFSPWRPCHAEEVVEGPYAPVPRHLVRVLDWLRDQAIIACRDQHDCANLEVQKSIDKRLSKHWSGCKSGDQSECDDYAAVVQEIEARLARSRSSTAAEPTAPAPRAACDPALSQSKFNACQSNFYNCSHMCRSQQYGVFSCLSGCNHFYDECVRLANCQ